MREAAPHEGAVSPARPSADEVGRFTSKALGFAPSAPTIASAFLLALAFPPWDLSVLAWVGLVPWLGSVKRASTTAVAVVQGFWLSFALGILAAHWMAYAIHEFLGISWPASVAGLIVFAATAAQPQFIFFALLFHWIQRTEGVSSSAVISSIGLALSYTAMDFFVPRLFDVGLGYALHEAAHLRQVADLGGVPLLTCLVVLVNLLVWQTAEAFARRRRFDARALMCIGCIVVLLGAAYVYGTIRNRELAAILADPVRILRAGVVQGNVANDVRLAWARGDDRAAEKQLSAYMLPTEELMQQTPRPELVVWPEATFPGVFRQPGTKLQQGRATKFDRQVVRLNVPIVFGAYDMEEESGRRVLFNSLYSITPSYDRPGRQGLVQRYRKHELLPFAETIPGVSRSEWLHRLLPSVGFFGRGPGADVIRIAGADGWSVLLGPIICSESLHSQHVIDGARKGSEVILNIGSDGWFGRSGEPYFHLAVARFRSIETRLPQIRAANTGISALILPNGELDERSALGEKQTLNLEVPIVRGTWTLMVRWGNWFGFAAAAGAAMFLAFHSVRHRHGPLRGAEDSAMERTGGAP